MLGRYAGRLNSGVRQLSKLMRTPEELVLEKPELFFGSKGPTGQRIAADIASDALTMGSTSVRCWHEHGWWLIAADLDWFNQPNTAGVNQENAFDTFWGMPEAGQNFFWHSFFAKMYSSATATSTNGISSLIKGDPSFLAVFNGIAANSPHQERIVGFRFSAA